MRGGGRWVCGWVEEGVRGGGEGRRMGGGGEGREGPKGKRMFSPVCALVLDPLLPPLELLSPLFPSRETDKGCVINICKEGGNMQL